VLIIRKRNISIVAIAKYDDCEIPMTYNGLTEGKENIRAFLGGKPNMGETADGRSKALFDVSWGTHSPENNKFGTWRHCIAYDKEAKYVSQCRPGTYLKIAGWLTTNQVYDEHGRRSFDKYNKPVTREYLIVTAILIIERVKTPQAKQLSLVA